MRTSVRLETALLEMPAQISLAQKMLFDEACISPLGDGGIAWFPPVLLEHVPPSLVYRQDLPHVVSGRRLPPLDALEHALAVMPSQSFWRVKIGPDNGPQRLDVRREQGVRAVVVQDCSQFIEGGKRESLRDRREAGSVCARENELKSELIAAKDMPTHPGFLEIQSHEPCIEILATRRCSLGPFGQIWIKLEEVREDRSDPLLEPTDVCDPVLGCLWVRNLWSVLVEGELRGTLTEHRV